jgi:putative ABC transport system ATP-binding protein
MTDALMVVEHVCKRVRDADGELTILDDVGFILPLQQTVAIVGASGSGKSTLLSILAGLDTPSSGRVLLEGQNLFDLDEDQRADIRSRRMGFVFQSFQLLAHLSALENVMLPLELLGHPKPRQQALEMLDRVGLASRVGHYPKVLSGGEQQRVALARAFVVKPALLLADEPTGSLDHATGERIMDLIFRMNRDEGTTLVMVTHDQAIAARCDRRLVIDAGRLTERT